MDLPQKRDLIDLPPYPPPLPPLAGAKEHRSCNPFQVLLLYCVGGALVGGGSGILAGSIAHVIHRGLRWNIFARAELGEIALFLLALMLAGSCYGVVCGGVLRLAVGQARFFKHPIFAGALCASLGGVVVMWRIVPNLGDRPPQGGEIIETAVISGFVMIFGAIFGGLHALVVRRAILWFEWWLNRKTLSLKQRDIVPTMAP